MTFSASSPNGLEAPRVLLLADHPEDISWLGFVLRRHFEVTSTVDLVEGLQLLESAGPFAVVLAGEKLTGTPGAALLEKMRAIAPETTRVLLVGEDLLREAFEAINGGRVFRTILKPCAAGAIVQTLSDAADQHRLVTSERVLLQQTLQGSILALVEVMTLASPLVFGKAQRIRKLTMELIADLPEQERWPVEMAALLSQIGCATLPRETVEKLYAGMELTSAEQEQVNRLPQVTEQLLGHIPRLEAVRALLRYPHHPLPAALEAVPEALRPGAHALLIAVDFDQMEGKGMSPNAALQWMQGRQIYDRQRLARFRSLHQVGPEEAAVQEIPLSQLQPGMILCDEVRSPTGILLIPHGFPVTSHVCDRIANFPAPMLRQTVRVQTGE